MKSPNLGQSSVIPPNMRRIIPHRPTTVVCAAVGGGRTTISAAGDGGFLPTDPKPNVRAPHSNIFGVLVGRESQSSWAVTPRKQLKNEERTRKALGILFRDYGGRAIQDEDEKVANMNTRELSQEEFNAFLKNLWIECEQDYKKYGTVRKEFHKVYREMIHRDKNDESGDATQNDRVDKLAEIAAEEELDAVVTNSFATKLMIECEPKYEKRFREIIEKVRKKMIQDDGILGTFEL